MSDDIFLGLILIALIVTAGPTVRQVKEDVTTCVFVAVLSIVMAIGVADMLLLAVRYGI